MATQTLHYHLTKPASADRVAVGDMNDNSDTIDGYLYQANERADQLADDYNTSSTYNTGDYVRRDNYIYKCNTDNTTGTWDDTKWDRVKITEELGNGGGGSSTLAGLNDVNISSPTDGQALVYDETTHKWVNRAGGGGSSTFAGLNDVDVAGVANKDIARFNSSTNKWEKSTDLTDLELSVSQLSSSVLSIAGDVDTLESTVSQMSASTLPYDANTSTKQKIDEVDAKIDAEVGGKAVYIGGVKSTEVSTQGSSITIVNVNDISSYKLLRIFTSYYKHNLGPDYGGTTISVNMFRRITPEVLFIAHWNKSYAFGIRYVSDTQVAIYFPTGTQADTNCLQIWAIL